jgi:ankyrin repeat protein
MFSIPKTETDIDNLINKGVDINQVDSLFGQTFLHILVQRNSSLLDYFLRKGPDTNISNKTGKTPLYYAKDVITVEKLIKYGASIIIQDLDGKTINDVNPKLMSNYIIYKQNNKIVA